MRKGSRWLGLVVSLALIVVMTVGTISAQASIYRVGKYDIYYYNKMQYWWARGLARYVPEAWRAAYTVIGNKMLYGQMQVRFYWANNNQNDFKYNGTQKIYLNRYRFFSYAKWGGTLAHETSRVLFNNYTKAAYWGASYMDYYRTFITETLARYTGDVAYRYGSRWSAATVKAKLNYYTNLLGYPWSRGKLNWIAFGSEYRFGGGNWLNAAIYGHAATGYFLTGGLKTSTSSRVAKLMYAMRVYSASPGRYCRSSDDRTAKAYFENAFKYAYGYHANMGGMLHGSIYLRDQFLRQWYI